MKIYTKTGDQGLTSLIGGVRVPKSSPRIDCYGTVDELNSYLGVLRDQDVSGPHLPTDPGRETQRRLPDLHAADVELLETEMDRMNEHLTPLREFVLPGGHQAVSFGHVARCVCRRAERLAVQLSAEAPVEDLILMYLNRLSDYLFVLSRQMAHDLGVPEVTWKPRV